MKEPHEDADYVAGLRRMAEERGWDPRVFPTVRMADGRCYACQEPGHAGKRLCCLDCNDEVAPGVPMLRCRRCHDEHNQAAHITSPPRSPGAGDGGDTGSAPPGGSPR